MEKTYLLCEEKCWLKNVEYYCFFLKFQGRIDCNNAEGVITVIEAPRQSDLLIELVRKLKPQVVVTSIAQFEAITSAAFSNILSATEDVGCRLFLDISENLEWSCLPSSNGVLKYLIGNTLPSHAFCEGDLYTISYHLAWNSIRTSVHSCTYIGNSLKVSFCICSILLLVKICRFILIWKLLLPFLRMLLSARHCHKQLSYWKEILL